jgi:hypothetical protein
MRMVIHPEGRLVSPNDPMISTMSRELNAGERAAPVFGLGIDDRCIVANKGYGLPCFTPVSSCTQPVDSLSFVVNELLTALNV